MIKEYLFNRLLLTQEASEGFSMHLLLAFLTLVILIGVNVIVFECVLAYSLFWCLSNDYAYSTTISAFFTAGIFFLQSVILFLCCYFAFRAKPSFNFFINKGSTLGKLITAFVNGYSGK